MSTTAKPPALPLRRLPRPRWQTPLPPGVVGSWGPDVEAWAQLELGIALDRWQRRALNRALVYGADGRLLHRHYLVSAGRQNGKTAMIRSLIGWALTAAETPAWATLLGLAHDKKQARVPYAAVHADLQPIRRRLPAGGLAITRYLGIRSDLFGRHREYDVASRDARDAIRTLSIDLALFDEIRTQRGFDTWAALEPTTRARPEPLVFAISSAGDDRSVLLRDWFDRGVRVIDGVEPFAGFGMTWYAAPDELAPDDPRGILAANPAVAEGRVPYGPVAGSFYSLAGEPAKYRQETLNLWSEGADEWLPPGTWPRQIGRQPAEAVRIVFGVEAVPSWRRATIMVGLLTDAGAWVGVAGELDAARTDAASIAPADLVELLNKLVADWRPAAIAYSAAAAAAPHVAAAIAGRSGIVDLPMGPRQIRAASQLFRSELIGGRLTHEDDAMLRAQVRVARPSSAIGGDDWFLSIRESLGEVDAVRAGAWAAWAAIAPEARRGTQIHV